MNINDISSKTQAYVQSLIQNPEWFKNAIARYGSGSAHIAKAIDDLELEIQKRERRE